MRADTIGLEDFYEKAYKNASSVGRTIVTPFLDVKSKEDNVDIKCNSCLRVVTRRLKNFCVKPRCCISCYKQESLEDLQKHVESLSTLPVGFVLKRGVSNSLSYYCPLCSHDDFVKKGLCSGDFPISTGNIKNGQISCRCSRRYIWTKEQQEFRISKQLKQGVTFQGWCGEYEGSKSKISLSCEEHGSWTPTLQDVINSDSGCPSCAITGYSENKKGTLYILSNGTTAKIGITNSSAIDRAAHVSRKAKNKFSVVREWSWEDGKVAQNLERNLLADLREFYKNPSEKHHGYTECFDYLNKELLVSLVEQEIEKVNYVC